VAPNRFEDFWRDEVRGFDSGDAKTQPLGRSHLIATWDCSFGQTVEVTLEAERKSARDARYAARKARRR
jgi:hypothetical protein